MFMRGKATVIFILSQAELKKKNNCTDMRREVKRTL